MKKCFLLFCIAGFLASCSKPAQIRVKITNPSDFDRISEMVEIPTADISAKLPLSDGETYIVKNSAAEAVPAQTTFDGKLIFQSGLKAHGTAVYSIVKGEPLEFKPQVYGRFIKERYDDFAWENDRVAFRIYGHALVPIDGPSNGIDAWYKKTPKLVIDEWYKKDLAGEQSYHEDHGEGLDDYKVGRSLGAGAMAPFVKDTLWLNENFVSQEVLENGPLRLTFRLIYNDITVDGQTFSESRTFSLDAGSQLTKVVQEYGTGSEIPVAAGIALREGGNVNVFSADNNYLLYQEDSPNAGAVFMGVLIPSGIDRTVENRYTVINPITKKPETHAHNLAVTKYEPGKPMVYYTGFGWSQYGFSDLMSFDIYMTRFAESLKTPLAVSF
ncbi:MAG: DUF4861 domain-containing protein [Dysgonamonadaceae bacterium]|jgi:hypothetical protein|nr:DUF4861 domain-containing protein [Dysgonamonadaceae bacterium]